jgi:hypothetical protein
MLYATYTAEGDKKDLFEKTAQTIINNIIF